MAALLSAAVDKVHKAPPPAQITASTDAVEQSRNRFEYRLGTVVLQVPIRGPSRLHTVVETFFTNHGPDSRRTL